jgi:hypothetical protein
MRFSEGVMKGHLKEEHKYDGTLYVYENRMKVLSDAFTKLENTHLEAQVEWGPEYKELIIPLRLCRTDLHLALTDFIEMKKPNVSLQDVGRERKELDAFLYQNNTKYDTFTPKINEAVELFEQWLRPYVENKTTSKDDRNLLFKKAKDFSI